MESDANGSKVARWKVAGELTQDEMNEAMQSLHRVDCPPPFGERYVRGGASCIIDFWLGVEHPRSHHFRADFHSVPDASEGQVGHREGMVAELVHTHGEVEFPQMIAARDEENRLGVAVFVVVGEVLQQGQWVNIGTCPVVGTPCYSVVRLEALNEPAMRWVKLFPSSPSLNPKRIRNVTDRVGKPIDKAAHIRHLCDAKNVIAGLRVEIGAEYCKVRWVGIQRRLVDVVFQCSEVAFCPTQLV